MATTATLDLALAFEPSEPDVMHRPPRLCARGTLTSGSTRPRLPERGVADASGSAAATALPLRARSAVPT